MSLPPKVLVLYADDDSDDIALISEAFGKFSHAIDLVTFTDGMELLEYTKQLTPFQPSPCLIILDINMPRLSGKEILQKLRRQKGFEETPVVLFSTSTLPSEAQFAMQYKAGSVTKPLVNSQINDIVEQLLTYCSDEVRKRIYHK